MEYVKPSTGAKWHAVQDGARLCDQKPADGERSETVLPAELCSRCSGLIAGASESPQEEPESSGGSEGAENPSSSTTAAVVTDNGESAVEGRLCRDQAAVKVGDVVRAFVPKNGGKLAKGVAQVVAVHEDQRNGAPVVDLRGLAFRDFSRSDLEIEGAVFQEAPEFVPTDHGRSGRNFWCLVPCPAPDSDARAAAAAPAAP